MKKVLFKSKKYVAFYCDCQKTTDDVEKTYAKPAIHERIRVFKKDTDGVDVFSHFVYKCTKCGKITHEDELIKVD